MKVKIEWVNAASGIVEKDVQTGITQIIVSEGSLFLFAGTIPRFEIKQKSILTMSVNQ